MNMEGSFLPCNEMEWKTSIKGTYFLFCLFTISLLLAKVGDRGLDFRRGHDPGVTPRGPFLLSDLYCYDEFCIVILLLRHVLLLITLYQVFPDYGLWPRSGP